MPPAYTRMLSRRSLVAGSLGATASAAAFALPTRCNGRIYPGVTSLGVDLSGTTRPEAIRTLEQALSPFMDAAVTLTFEDRTWTARITDLGGTIETTAMVDAAMARGHQEGLIERYSALLGVAETDDLALQISLEPGGVRRYLETINQDMGRDPINARLVIAADGTVDILAGHEGRELDLEKAESEILAALPQGKPVTIALQSRSVRPMVTGETLERSQDQAVQLVMAPVMLTHNDETYPLTEDDLSQALVIALDGTSYLDAGRIPDRIDAIAEAVRVAPHNVKLGWDDGLYVVEDDINGQELDRGGLNDLLTATARRPDRMAALPLRDLPAAARVDNLSTLGLDEHLAYGSSAFTGSSEARATNVIVSATNISYKLVGPGEEFSFNDLLGPITPDMGYVTGTIIQGDWAASDIGGGVCQVSTTVFRAAARAGFQFQEWHPHSWRLGFYEVDGSPPGFDGAIYQPNDDGEWEKDLRFINPLDSWLLLMLVVDGTTVRAHFYGRNPGWIVDIGEAVVSDPKPIPDPVERYNPALAPGERQMVQQARPGYIVRIRRTVTDAAGIVLSDGDFVSDYRSQPEAWEIG